MRLLGAVGKYCRMRSILGFTVSCLLVFVVFYFSDDLNFYWRCEAGEAGGIGVASENGHGARCVSQVQIVHTQLYSLFYVRSPLSRALANKHPDSDREVHGGGRWRQTSGVLNISYITFPSAEGSHSASTRFRAIEAHELHT